jgi:hypothetical protein
MKPQILEVWEFLSMLVTLMPYNIQERVTYPLKY